MNKWDLLTKKPNAEEEYLKHVQFQLKFMSWVPVIFGSVKTGYNIDGILSRVVNIFYERSARFTTNELNEVIRRASLRHKAGEGKRKLSVKFASQADLYPPTFVFFVNDENLVHFSYKRFLENCLREFHSFEGTPVRLVFRKNEGKEKMKLLPKNSKNKPIIARAKRRRAHLKAAAEKRKEDEKTAKPIVSKQPVQFTKNVKSENDKKTTSKAPKTAKKTEERKEEKKVVKKEVKKEEPEKKKVKVAKVPKSNVGESSSTFGKAKKSKKSSKKPILKSLKPKHRVSFARSKP